MGGKSSQSDQLFTELAEWPSQNSSVRVFNSIRKTENVLSYGGIHRGLANRAPSVGDAIACRPAPDGKDVDSRSSLTRDWDGSQHGIPGMQFADWQCSPSLESPLHRGLETWTPAFTDSCSAGTTNTMSISRYAAAHRGLVTATDIAALKGSNTAVPRRHGRTPSTY